MCTVFTKNTSKGMVAARNHSWCQPGGNLHFIPSKRLYGKAVNAMILMDQWGQDRPFDGMNEHGLFIGCAGFPDDLSPLGKQKPKPHGLDIFGIIRFVLERAKSTAEAALVADKEDADAAGALARAELRLRVAGTEA